MAGSSARGRAPSWTLVCVILATLHFGVLSARPASRRRLHEDLDTHISLSQTEKAKELEQMKQWVADTPHIPGAALAKALEAAAWRPADNSSRGLVIVNSGSKYAFDELLPRWLASMTQTLDGDISQHTVIVTLGSSAQDLCVGMQQGSGHQCVLLTHWTGPDRMYHFADDWYTVVTLSKLELLLNVVSLGYDAVWMDTDVVHVRNPLPFLAAQDVDVAVTSEHCVDDAQQMLDDVLSGRKGDDIYVFNTGVTYLAAGAGTVRFARDWLHAQQVRMLAALEGDWEATPALERPHDQRTFHQHMLPQLQHDPAAPVQPYVKLGVLNQTHFPNHCGGWCGCNGSSPVGPSHLIAHNDAAGNLLSGRLQCPAEAWRDWITYHMPCVHSFHEKMGLLDAYQSALSQLADAPELEHSPLGHSNTSDLASSRRSVRRSRTA